jgi:hypothetical protein
MFWTIPAIVPKLVLATAAGAMSRPTQIRSTFKKIQKWKKAQEHGKGHKHHKGHDEHSNASHHADKSSNYVMDVNATDHKEASVSLLPHNDALSSSSPHQVVEPL